MESIMGGGPDGDGGRVKWATERTLRTDFLMLIVLSKGGFEGLGDGRLNGAQEACTLHINYK